MNLTNISSAYQLDNKTVLLSDSPAFSHYEKASNIQLDIKSKVFIENPYNDFITTKLMISFDIRDQETRSSIYLTYNRLSGFINDLKVVLKDNLYNETNGWFKKYQTHIQLNDQRVDNGTLKDIKIQIADGKEFSIKPWKSAASPEPSLILSVDNGAKHTTIDLPVPLFEIMIQKLVELRNNFETIKIGIVNQYILSNILNGNMNQRNIAPQQIIPQNTQILNTTTTIQPMISDEEDSVIINTPSIKEESVVVTEVFDMDQSSNNNDSILNESFNVLFDNKMNDTGEVKHTSLKQEVSPLSNLNLIESTSIVSTFLTKKSDITSIISEYMVAHINNTTLKSLVYCNDVTVNQKTINDLKLSIDTLLRPIDKANPNTSHLTYKLRDMKLFPFYDYTRTYSETESYFILESIIVGLYSAIIRTLVTKDVTDHQVIFRTFITLNYESILIYMISLHYNHLRDLKRINDSLKTKVHKIVNTYIANQESITKELNKTISLYSDNPLNLSPLFNVDTIYNLLEKLLDYAPPKPQSLLVKVSELPNEPVAPKESPGVPLKIADNDTALPVITVAEPIKPIVKVPEQIIYPDKPNILLVTSKLIPDVSNREIVNKALENCNLTFAQILSEPNLEQLLKLIDDCPLILKVIILEWSPMSKKYHRDLDLFKGYCSDKNRELKAMDEEQKKELDLSASLKISSLVKINELLNGNRTTITNLLANYNYYENIENLYDEVKQQLNKITTNPFVTGVIIEHFISKR